MTFITDKEKNKHEDLKRSHSVWETESSLV